MVDFLKETMHPSQISCMLALLTPGVVMVFAPSLSRWGRRWIVAVMIFYVVLSTEPGALLLARTLTGQYQPLATAAQARGARVVVLLGGGSTNLRSSGRQLSSVNMPVGLRVLE